MSSLIRTSFTRAGERAFITNSLGSSEKGTMSTFSPRSSLTTMRTRGAPRHRRRPHRVDVVVVRPHRDLGAVTGLAGHCLELDDAVADLGHLELEESLDQTRVRAADDDLGALGGGRTSTMYAFSRALCS